MAGNATFITYEVLLLFVFSLMQAGVQSSVPITEQESEFESHWLSINLYCSPLCFLYAVQRYC